MGALQIVEKKKVLSAAWHTVYAGTYAGRRIFFSKKLRYNFSAFFVTPTLPAPSGVPGSRKRPSLLSLACASGRLSFAVGERYYCVYFLSAISFHVRTYADASFHITIQARFTNTRFTYVQSSTLLEKNILWNDFLQQFVREKYSVE